MASRRRFRTVVVSCLLTAILAAAGTGAYAWYRLDRMFEAARHISPHAPGTYYFAGLRGGVFGPFQPRDEISMAEALSSSIYCPRMYDGCRPGGGNATSKVLDACRRENVECIIFAHNEDIEVPYEIID